MEAIGESGKQRKKMVKTKPNQKIHVDKLQTTLEKLGQLKEKPKSELNLRESIYYPSFVTLRIQTVTNKSDYPERKNG